MNLLSMLNPLSLYTPTGDVMDANANIRIYIDGEILPSIDFQLYLGHGIGLGDKSAAAPWSTKRISLDAYHGIYNTYQIPFSKSVKITATHPDGGVFWYIVRGVYNYPLVFGMLQLPSTARLRLYKKVHMTLEPFEFMDMVHVQGTAGAIFQVTLAANSSTFRDLEGCVRAYVDGDDKTLWLSSGTEDFFLSAYYFNEGIFHSDNSGLTYLQRPGAMSAYKFFETDPLLFTKSFRLTWRSGELVGSGMDDCPNDFRKPKGNIDASPELKTTIATTYAWVYEW